MQSQAADLSVTEQEYYRTNVSEVYGLDENVTLEYTEFTLLKENGVQSQPNDRNLNNNDLIFSSNIYTIRSAYAPSHFLSFIAYEKRENVIGLGIIGTVTLGLMQQENWHIDLTGKVSGSHLKDDPTLLKNRWNITHQFGGGAYYHVNDALQISLDAHFYHIINDLHYDNPEEIYIKSHGGFAKILVKF